MIYEFINDVAPSEHDAFVASHDLCNLLQSSSWAKVKDNWDHMIVGVREGGELVASALVLIKRLSTRYCLFYIPRGPVLDYENIELLSFFTERLKGIAKRRHALHIIMDPAIRCNDYAVQEKNDDRYPEALRLIDSLRTLGIYHKGFVKELDAAIQPRYHANVYRKDDLLNSFSKRARKAIATAEKKKVDVKAYGKEAVSDFASVLHCTEKRKHIALRDGRYFEKLMDAYGNDAVIYLAKLPLKEIYDDYVLKLEENIRELAKCPQNAKKKKATLKEQRTSYEREVHDLEQLMDEQGDEAVIAGALCVRFGKTAELLYAGMNDTYKRYMAPYTTFFRCMEWSFQHGCESCNMGGVEGDLNGGLSTFKESFSPVINEYIGEFDLPVTKPLYAVFQLLMKLCRKRYQYH